MSNKVQVPYNEIAKSIIERKCALFLGAGTSYDKENQEGVSTHSLISKLSQELEDEGFPLPNENWGLSSVAQYYAVKIGRDRMEWSVKNFIDKNTKPLKIHELLSKFPPITIFTTNYDRNIETKLKEEGREREYEAIVSQDDFQKWDKAKTMIVKLHGSIERAVPLIITDDDYVKFLMEPNLLKDAFKHILSTEMMIFIGYSLSDYNIKLLLEEVNKTIKREKESARCRGYLIQSTIFGEKEKEYWKDKGLEILSLNGNEFLENLKDAIDTFGVKDIFGERFDFWLDNYRLAAIRYFEEKVINKFIRDIEESRVNMEDYSFKNDMKEIFKSPKNQEKLIPLFEDGNINVIETILEHIKLSEDIITEILIKSDRQKEGGLCSIILEYLLGYEFEKLPERAKEHILFISGDLESSEEVREKAKAILKKANML